jgi:hypothetical protein
MIMTHAETLAKTRGVDDQIKALKRQRTRLLHKKERILLNDSMRKKNAENPVRFSNPERALVYSSNVPGAHKINLRFEDSKVAPLTPEDKAKLAKLDSLLKQVDYNLWCLEGGKTGSGHFNRNAVKRPRHLETVDRGKTIFTEYKATDRNNNWRKRMTAKAIAKALYETDLSPETQGLFNQALKEYDKLSDKGKNLVAQFQQEVARKKLSDPPLPSVHFNTRQKRKRGKGTY